MKKLITSVIGVGLISVTITAFAQSSMKIGHVDINEIMASLPERDSVQVLLEKETKEIESAYEEMKVIYNKLVDDYQNGMSTFSELVKKTKESEILDKQKRLQEFEQNASTPPIVGL